MANHYFSSKKITRDRLNLSIWNLIHLPLSFITAPIGWGKTTAIKDFMAAYRNDNLKFIYYVVEGYDSCIDIGWEKFYDILPLTGDNLGEAIKRIGYPCLNYHIDKILRSLSNINIKKPVVLIIDDYQNNTHNGYSRLISEIVKLEIPNFHIMILSRNSPNVLFGDLILKGLASELVKDEIIFDFAETKKLFTINGVDLNDSELEEMYQYTGGWISGINLVIGHYKKYGNIDYMENINTLIAGEIVDKFQPFRKKLLIGIAPIDSITIDQVKFLYGPEGVAELRLLVEENGFVRFDPQNGEYTINGMLKRVLMEEYTFGHYNIDDVFNNIAKYYQEADNWVMALVYYNKSRNYAKMLDVMSMPGAVACHEKIPMLLYDALQNIPLSLKLSKPIGYITWLYCLLYLNKHEECYKLISEAKEYLDNQENSLNKNHIMGEVIILTAICKYCNLSDMLSEILGAQPYLNGDKELILGSASIISLSIPTSLYLCDISEGSLGDNLKDSTIQLKAVADMIASFPNGLETILNAEYCLELGEFDRAKLLVYKAWNEAKVYGQYDCLVSIFCCVQRLNIVTQDNTDISELNDKIVDIITVPENNLIRDFYELGAANICGLVEDLVSIPDWIKNFDASLYTDYHFILCGNMVFCKVMVINQEYSRLEVVVESIIKESTQKMKNPTMLIIFAYIYDSIAKYNLYGEAAGVKSLDKAIQAADRDGIVLPFIENANYILPFLNDAKLRVLCNRYKDNYGKSNKTHFTKRELEIMNLLVKGKKQWEIAEILYISVDTVKFHLKNIYKKLRVSSKVQAIDVYRNKDKQS